MTLVFFAAALMRQTRAPEALLRGYVAVLVAAGAAMGGLLIARFGVRHVYHEQVFLIIPLAALFLVPPRRGVAAWLAGLFFLSMAWFSQKYTAYLTGALTLAYLGAFVALPRLRGRPALDRVTIAYWAALVALVGALAFALAVQSVGVPSGNTEYRLHTYAAALERFAASPWWGSLFASEAVEEFKLFTIGIAANVLPTHSDLLDILAHGGVLAALLWLAGIARIARIAYAHRLGPALLDDPLARYAHALALMSLAAILTYAFNPILLQPGMAYFVWTNLGLLLGLGLRAEPGPVRLAPLRAHGLLHRGP
jgi:O-antigen ligase